MEVTQRIRLISSDLDGTLIGKPDSTLDFKKTIEELGGRAPILVYNTGRLVNDALDVVRHHHLPDSDYLIGGVGTMILDVKRGREMHEFEDFLGKGWDRSKVHDVMRELDGIEEQAEVQQNRWKCSWHWRQRSREDLDGVRAALSAVGVDAQVIYSSSEDLDIIPAGANKANALAWLCETLKIPLEQVIVAGDTGNDAAMYTLPGVRGIVVENAEPELLEALVGMDFYRARGVCAAGVLEGLIHYGVVDEAPPLSGFGETVRHDPEIERLVRPQTTTAGSERSFLQLAYSKALESLEKCVTPSGFSACSIADNHFVGTDQNYNSVWGRDGAMAITGSLFAHDDRFRDCQRATLETLLSHLAENGQVPANVHIETGVPDYSGVGGIAAIDSGMWVLIAMHAFVEKTGEVELLEKYRGPLSSIMRWLEAHDSNQDDLLEIPEAGDWMDLFNRSYNVLYDEVLWCRANVCYGKMMELIGDGEGAGRHYHRAERAKAAVLQRFWPKTVRLPGQEVVRFDQVQQALGDARYLLAQVTPFSFDWRCDVAGNVMAFLMNVLDYDRAKVAFRFMWGVGVNQPFPARNLYPVVHAGDPDWKSYYTVNLLNLPHHYHNGGIWGWIGGQWVRFVHRLGLRDIAWKELLKLAEMSHQGISEEWEFNEWYHGETGRPMGKAFQAWSASEFIAAYQEVTRGEGGAL